jgi:hypothetical protein
MGTKKERKNPKSTPTLMKKHYLCSQINLSKQQTINPIINQIHSK